MSEFVGVDIGGTGIKVATVDTATGTLSSPRKRAATPRPATPEATAFVVAELVAEVGVEGPIGAGFPGVVQRGVAATAANLDPSWVGVDVAALLSDHMGARPVSVINDADAAGLAEIRFASGAEQTGVVVMITLGTGIGTAIFNDGILVPNAEFGHLVIGSAEAEKFASGGAKDRPGSTWEHWTGHLEDFLRELEHLLWPELFVIGGGISSEFRRFCAGLNTRTSVIAATLGNDAGIVGAALAAEASMTSDPPRRASTR